MSIINDITLGQYYPIDSFIHRLDPRTKLIVIFMFMTALFITQKLIGFGLAIFFVFGGIKFSQIPVSLSLRNLRPFLWLLLLTLFIHLFFPPEKSEFFEIPIIHINIYKQGLINGLIYSLRLALLIIVAALLTLTTSPIEITDALEVLSRPLKRLGVPTHELTMIMSLALRFIPTLIAEADRLRKAQISRGVSFHGNLIKRVKNMIPLILPLLLSVFRRADELALAMDARCYAGGDGRTRFKELKFNRCDHYILAGTVLFFAVICVI